MTNLRFLLSSNIKKRREELGLSQALLAEKAGISPHHIAQIEQQNRFPKPETLERIAVALEINSSELFFAGPYPKEAIQKFHEGIKEDIEKRLECLMKSI